ncbi:MarR family winged helix-turn-helix transcriptional regulator [Bacilliculturomica massiliensis]|uniref:MarR family winged helix-turn-helix transcriptional regulator n=1 Tax=Bacilliculturomica massiliensis TaxID=1917867 RepID=UPI001030360D|nr:MarR family transcriptional regulator [Bacilliculturomica massiliensis]
MKDERFYYSEVFKKIANGQNALMNNGMWKHGITYVQSMVILHLYLLRMNNGPEHEVTQKELEKYLSLRGSTVALILDRMEENGCIIRKKSTKDSRANQILLTEKGETFLPLFFKRLDEVERLMTEGLSEEEQLLLKNLLIRVWGNLEKHKD